MIGFVWVMSHFGVGLDGFQGGFCCRMEVRKFYGRKVSERENFPFMGRIVKWYRYQTVVVPVPMIQNQNGVGTKKGWYRYQ